MIFFTAETHFGHGGALGLYRRPFADVPEMDEVMDRLWNETISPNDVVWHLGDVAVGSPRARSSSLFAERLRARLTGLNGRRHLIAGNNDSDEVLSWPGWSSVQPHAEIVVDKTPLTLTPLCASVMERH